MKRREAKKKICDQLMMAHMSDMNTICGETHIERDAVLAITNRMVSVAKCETLEDALFQWYAHYGYVPSEEDTFTHALNLFVEDWQVRKVDQHSVKV